MNVDFLRSVYEDRYGPLDTTPGKLKNLEELAGTLSRIVEHEPAWTARYLNAILCGHKGFSVTRELGIAIQVMVDKLDDVHPLQARLVQITAYSVNGSVQPGSIITGHSMRCVCGTLFVPHHNLQKYCCKECPGRPLKRKAKAAAIYNEASE